MESLDEINSEGEIGDEHPQLAKLKDLFSKDIVLAKHESQKMVEDIKTNINTLLSRLKIVSLYSDSTESIIENQSKAEKGKEISVFVRNSIAELRKKAALDIQIVQLYDEYLTKETAHKIKTKCVGKHMKLLVDKVVTDFQNYNEATEDMIKNFETTLENYMRGTTGEDEQVMESLGTKVLVKTMNDIEKQRDCTIANIEKTKNAIYENMQVFLINPNGKKTEEEIQSEEFIKENIIDLKNKVGRDLLAAKEITDKIAQRTKKVIVENLISLDEDFIDTKTISQLPDFSIGERNFREIENQVNQNNDANTFLAKLHDSAVADFQETDKTIQEDVNNLKSKIKDLKKNIEE